MKLNAGESLDLTYGVAVCDGELAAPAIEQLYQRWLRRSAKR